MSYTTSGAAYGSISSRQTELDRARRSILKQLSQMDLENNVAQELITQIVEEMVFKIDQIKTQLSSIHFE